jgi:long-chain acyl-CoA synthetase
LASYEADTIHVPFQDLIDNDGKHDHVDTDPVNDVAVLQYTGGTTGVPKGAMLTHRNLHINTYQPYHWFSTKVDDGQEKVLAVLPFFHVYAMTTVMNFGILVGAEIVLLPRFDLVQTLKAISKEKPGFFNAVPTIYNAINNHKDLHKYDLSSLKMCISGGAPLPVEVLKTFEKNAKNAVLVEGYGLSETSPIACINPYEDVRVDGSIGLPVGLTEVRIISTEDGETLMPIGEKGEICIKGPQVMKGYWKNQEATARDLRRGFFHTGDIGYMDERGFIYIVDRMKDVIIASGYNVYPRNIEEALYQHPNVEECIVLGVPDKYRGETVKAYIKTHDGEDIPIDSLKAFLKEKLSPIEMPKLYEFREELPKTMIGKLSKKELREEIEKENQG